MYYNFKGNYMSITINTKLKDSKKFLKYVKETYLDFKSWNSDDIRVIHYTSDIECQLKDILDKKVLSIMNVGLLLNLIYSRLEKIEFHRTNERPHIFKQLNKEHKFMKEYLNRYFESNTYDNCLRSISIRKRG